MVRLPARLTDLPPPAGGSGMADHGREPAPASASTRVAMAVAAPPNMPTAQVMAQSRATRRRAQNTSVASNDVAPSDLSNLDFSQLQIESDSSDSDFRPARHPATGAGHLRTLSNPFPSLFSPKKKKTTQNEPLSGFGGSGSSGDDELLSTRRRAVQQTEVGQQAPAPVAHPRKPDLATGPCITCGSIMRWARGVEAFRCGICLTINDLGPAKKSPDRRDSLPGPVSSGPDPISIQHTRELIHGCLQSYLEAVLSNAASDPAALPYLAEGAAQTLASATTYASHTAERPHGTLRESPHAGPVTETRALTANGDEPVLQPYRHADAPSQQFPRQLSGDHARSLAGHRPPQHGQPTRGSLAYHSYSRSGSHLLDTFQPPPGTCASASAHGQEPASRKCQEKEAKRIFLRLEGYIIDHILSVDCFKGSFVPEKHPNTRRDSHGPFSSKHKEASVEATGGVTPTASDNLPPERDTKLQRAEGIAESSSWWDNVQGRLRPPRSGHPHQHNGRRSTGSADTSRPICIAWGAVDEWYNAILNAGMTWEVVYSELVAQGKCASQPTFLLEQLESQILKGQQHTQRVLLKAIETALKRPRRRIGVSGDFRFLIIALANPLLHGSGKLFRGTLQRGGCSREEQTGRGTGPASGQHSVIIKRILGLMSNASDEWHSRIVDSFARVSEARFLEIKDLVSGFLAYRLVRYNEKQRETEHTDVADTLVPNVPEGATAASFHAALNQAPSVATKTSQSTDRKMAHGDDWQIKAAVRVLGLLFAANNLGCVHQSGAERSYMREGARGTGSRALLRGQILPTSDFYITLLDNCDLVADFEGWERQTTKFAFCQYPFLLSVWAKIQILEYEARRQMKNKARDAFFDSIMTHRNFDQHLILNVRRDCLVEDSLKGVSAAIGSGTDDIKKGLRIIFNGEEGIDAGGLRKEWFLLLVREVFNPDHGMFSYDEESQYCYFSPTSFETSDQFFLVGVVLGLAIYNSTILDVALPPFAFRKLLLAAPTPSVGLGAGQRRPAMSYTLSDLAEFQPRLAKGLQKLLDYDGDVESTFCLEFTITVDRYGTTDTIPLCPGGEKRAVTNSNRDEYVNLYVRYLLETAVSRQFEPFKRGFFTVCGCNALGLFRPEEIELLVRGSDEPLDVASLRLAASYENWPSSNPVEDEPTIRWFWELFEEASSRDQRKLLIFITGSDRIPATGPASLSMRILCLGKDTGRFPTARTCFNTLTLYRYDARETLKRHLWVAVNESEGFGLK